MRARKDSEGDHGSTLAYQKVTASSAGSQKRMKQRRKDFEEEIKTLENKKAAKFSVQHEIRCHFCGVGCAAFFRSGDKPGPARKSSGGVIKKGPLVFEGATHDF